MAARLTVTIRQVLEDGSEAAADGDLDDYMRYYKQRYRDEHHLARYV